MQAQRKQILDAVGILKSVSGIKCGVKFGYWVAKNIKAIEPEIEITQLAMKPSEGFEKFDAAKRELILSLAEKRDDGSPVADINGMVYVTAENSAAFGAALKALSEEHKDAIEEEAGRNPEKEAFMNEMASFDGHWINLDNIPDDMLTAQQLGILIDVGLVRTTDG